jgi:hypothetical protein
MVQRFSVLSTEYRVHGGGSKVVGYRVQVQCF